MSSLKQRPPFQSIKQKDKSQQQFSYSTILPNTLSPSTQERPMSQHLNQNQIYPHFHQNCQNTKIQDPRIAYYSQNSQTNQFTPQLQNKNIDESHPTRSYHHNLRQKSSRSTTEPHHRNWKSNKLQTNHNQEWRNNYSRRQNYRQYKPRNYYENNTNNMNIESQMATNQRQPNSYKSSSLVAYPEFTVQKNAFGNSYHKPILTQQMGYQQGNMKINKAEQKQMEFNQHAYQNYNEFYKNNLLQKIKNIKSEIKSLEKYFTEFEWQLLLEGLEKVLHQKNEGIVLLWNLIDSFKGSMKLKKGEKIFEILSLIECQQLFDDLKEHENIIKRQQYSRTSKIKKLLCKLTKKL